MFRVYNKLDIYFVLSLCCKFGHTREPSLLRVIQRGASQGKIESSTEYFSLSRAISSLRATASSFRTPHNFPRL